MRRVVQSIVVGILWFGGTARADDAADRAEAKRLVDKRNRAEAERDAAKAGTQPGRDDRVKAPLSSTQTKTDRHGNVITINQGGPGNAGQLTDPANVRIQNNRRTFDEKNRELVQINARLGELERRNPDAVRWASRSDRDAGGKILTTIVLVPLVIAAAPMIALMLPPGTGQVSANARFLGAGNRPGIDGLQGDGFLVSVRQERVISPKVSQTMGLMTAFRVEFGGYRDHGAIGSIGTDAGPGLRGRRGYLGATIGAHWTASLYQSAGWFPVQVHTGWIGGRWSVAMSGGFGWRRDLPDDGSAASMITTKGPAGTTSSTFRIAVQRKLVQVGFSIDDFDGNRIGSVNLGIGARLLGRNPLGVRL